MGSWTFEVAHSTNFSGQIDWCQHQTAESLLSTSFGQITKPSKLLLESRLKASSWLTPPIWSAGYVMLVLIIVLIVGLCVVLYMLRRNSRVRLTDKKRLQFTSSILALHWMIDVLHFQTYSFDLQRPLPVNYANEPTGTFEPVHLDDLGALNFIEMMQM